MEFCAIRENEGREKIIGDKFKKEDLVTAEFVREQIALVKLLFHQILIIMNLNQW